MRQVEASAIVYDCEVARQIEDAGDFARAKEYIYEAWQHLDDLPTIARAEILLRMGSIASRAGSANILGAEQDSAKDLLTESLRLFEAEGNRSKIAEASLGLALCCWQEGAFEDAHVWLGQSATYTPSSDTSLKFRWSILSAIVEENAGHIYRAHDILRSIAPLCNGLDNHLLLGKYHNQYQIVLMHLAAETDDYDYYDRALVENAASSFHFESGGNKRAAISVKNNAGNILTLMGRPADALKPIDEAIHMAERLKDRTRLAQCLETRAQALLALRRYAEAEKAARRSVQLLRIGGERSLLCESLITLGRCHARMGNKALAVQCFDEAVEVAEFIGYKEGRGLVSLATLEEFDDLDIEARRAHHAIIATDLKTTQDAALRRRAESCLQRTCDLMRAEYALPSPSKQKFTFPKDFSLKQFIDEIEGEVIRQAFVYAGGCQRIAARTLGVSDSNLNAKLKGKHKSIKALQTKGHYRVGDVGADIEAILNIDSHKMPDDSLCGFGIFEHDFVVVRRGVPAASGSPVAVRSRGHVYIGVLSHIPGGIELLSTDETDESWELPDKDVEAVELVVGWIKHEEIDGGIDAVRSL
jgi:tetratricopeptide (TPR) repeat protein